MTWFKVDDGFWSHPKVLQLSLPARGLWVSAGAYCAAHLTDGFIAEPALPTVAGYARNADKYAAELVAARLWDRESGGWRFHDWTDMQPTRASIEERRAADRLKKQRQRRSSGGQFRVVEGGSP